MGTNRATGLPCLAIVKLSPRATRPSNLGKFLLASLTPIVSIIFSLRELGQEYTAKTINRNSAPADGTLGKPAETPLGIPF